MIESLRTAVSAKNPEWLETNSKLIEERKSAGQLNDEEYAALNAIVAKARAGDWSTADADALALARAQKPTVAAEAAK